MIIKKYSNNNEAKLCDELINNFEAIYYSITKDEIIDKNDNDYYDKLRFILFKEIKKCLILTMVIKYWKNYLNQMK